MALIRPSHQTPDVVVEAVAARDRERARQFAARHHVPHVHESYEALLADSDLDAIYNPLPNALHCTWTIRALEAGKHVLCEKPLASNTTEAERMAAAAKRARRVLMEAFHYRYHPLAARMREIIDSGELGRINHVETHMCIPLPLPRDIRYRYDLGGGATMDTGCYAISLLRFLAGEEPEVVSASAALASPKVDRWMAADFKFPSGAGGRMSCALLSSEVVRISARVRGDHGEMRVLNPIVPQLGHRLKVRSQRRRAVERLRGDATYTYQLRAFAQAVRTGRTPPTDAREAIANMTVIDSVYRKAGLPLRGESSKVGGGPPRGDA